jgi:hypothetical protein
MFIPTDGYLEVEPISQSELASDQKEFISCAKVISPTHWPTGDTMSSIKEGDIIFFRPHGMFETPEYEGKKHYVVRVSEEFILGKYDKTLAKK